MLRFESGEDDTAAFSISHGSDGTFHLEIHAASPAELSPVSARRLRAVLRGLAREVEEASSPEGIRGPQATTAGRMEATQ